MSPCRWDGGVPQSSCAAKMLTRQPSARGISETCVGAGPGAISPGNSGIFAGAGAGTGSGGGSGSGSASAPGEPTTVPMAAAVANAAKRRRTRLMANSNCVGRIDRIVNPKIFNNKLREWEDYYNYHHPRPPRRPTTPGSDPSSCLRTSDREVKTTPPAPTDQSSTQVDPSLPGRQDRQDRR
jgi:hypothetical protein